MGACGNEQVFGINYDITFSAVIDLGTGKLLLALARTWGISAMYRNVPNAYVKAPTEKNLNLYLRVPQGMEISTTKLEEFGVPSGEQLVRRLQKSIYGLNQAGGLWIQLLHDKLSDAVFTQTLTDSCLYYDQDSSGITVLEVYVDDILVTGTSVARIELTFVRFLIKNIGPVRKFLGIRD